VTSFNAADTDAYRIVGTKGDVRVSPGYEYAESLSYELTIDGKTKRVRRRRTDQFAAELLYFSNCILKDRIPEPSGEEGLQDVRIVEALYTSSRTGKTVKLPPFTKTSRPDREQVIMRPPVKKPQLIKEQSASED
jgi:glucose-fructose oxidoreductase